MTNYQMFSLKRNKKFINKSKEVKNYYHFTLIVPVKNEEKNIKIHLLILIKLIILMINLKLL